MLQEAYEFNKSLYADTVHSWYCFVLNIYQKAGLDASDFETYNQPYCKIEYFIRMKFKQITHDVFTNQVFSKLSFWNSKIKNEINLEDNVLGSNFLKLDN